MQSYSQITIDKPQFTAFDSGPSSNDDYLGHFKKL